MKSLVFSYWSHFSSRSSRCFTDGTGPDVYKSCSKKWVKPNKKTKDVYGQYDDVSGHGECSMQPPPSALNEICKNFHKKIDDLKYEFLILIDNSVEPMQIH